MPEAGRFARLAVFLLLCLVAVPAGAQQVTCETGDREVRELDFEGNTTWPDGELANIIITTQSSWARRYLKVIGQRFCLDTTVVEEDRLRVLLYYQLRGFRGTSVRHDVIPIGDDAALVRFTIKEGKPLLIDSLTINGLDAVEARERITRGLPLRAGERLDRPLMEATRDTLTRRLRNAGYPRAEVLRNVDTDTATLRALVWFDVSTGPRTWIDSISITVRGRTPGRAPSVSEARVRETLGISRGDLFSARNLESVKRGLYLTEAFQHIDVSLDTTTISSATDSLITINVTLVESELHNARTAIGWGNYDCLRAQGSIATANFLGGLRRLELTGRVSRIGSGRPFDFGNALCPSHVREDFYSDTLNYYVGATYSQPALFGRRVLPSLTVYSERRSEFKTYVREVLYGLVGAVQLGSESRLPTSFTYQLEYGRTGAQPAYFCGVFNICDVATYSDLTSKARRNAVLGWAAVRSTANDLSDPSRGSTTRFEVRHASPIVGSDADIEFSRATLDATWYFPMPNRGRIVFRMRGGTVLSDRALDGTARFIPPQERMYAGGGNSVRGYGQNELGPLLYLVDTFNIVAGPDGTFYRADVDSLAIRSNRLEQPTGGDNLIVANVEMRLRSPVLPDLIQYALFADAGEVWNRGSSSVGTAFRRLKVTPGAGVRVFTPIGPLRVDVAFGPRRLTPGAVYFTPRQRTGQFDPVFCVSPGNILQVTPNGQESGPCPSSFAPPERDSFVKRLRFHFSIGQPF